MDQSLLKMQSISIYIFTPNLEVPKVRYKESQDDFVILVVVFSKGTRKNH